MGSVWAAHHLTLNTEVAVKFMSPELVSSEHARARFEREAQAAAQLSSPHVVRVFDHGVSADGLPFITMELVKGEDLGSMLRRQDPLPLELVREIVVQTARALAAAHRLGVVHRDIKPENLLVSDEEGAPFVRVLDFGIAKRHTELDHGLTSSGDMLGTPFTMSPEQVKSTRHVDFRSDLWSLAVVAYRALTGRWPFLGETLGDLLININEGRYPEPTQLRHELGPAADAWVARGLAHEPSARFGSARELGDTFADALARATGSAAPGERGSARPGTQAPGGDTLTPASSTAHGRSRGNRARRRVGFAAAAAALVVGLGVLGWWLLSEPVAPTAGPEPAVSSAASASKPAAVVQRMPEPTPSSAPPAAANIESPRPEGQAQAPAIAVVATPAPTEDGGARAPERQTGGLAPQRPRPRVSARGSVSAPAPAPKTAERPKTITAPVRDPGF